MINFPNQDDYFQIVAPEAETTKSLFQVLSKVLDDQHCYLTEPLTEFISYQNDDCIINLPFNLRKSLDLQAFLQDLCYNISNDLDYQTDALWATTYTINIQINQQQFCLANDNGNLTVQYIN